MILCAVCKYWQHGICFLIRDEDEAPQIHFCDVCSEARYCYSERIFHFNVQEMFNCYQKDEMLQDLKLC
jgi:hypothetical protein